MAHAVVVQGKCHRGESCRFIHPENPNIRAQLEMNGRNAQYQRKLNRGLMVSNTPQPTLTPTGYTVANVSKRKKHFYYNWLCDVSYATSIKNSFTVSRQLYVYSGTSEQFSSSNHSRQLAIE